MTNLELATFIQKLSYPVFVPVFKGKNGSTKCVFVEAERNQFIKTLLSEPENTSWEAPFLHENTIWLGLSE